MKTENLAESSRREVVAALGSIHDISCYVAEAAEILIKQWAPDLCAEDRPVLFKGLVETIERAAGKQLDAIESIQKELGIDQIDWADVRDDQPVYQPIGGKFSKSCHAEGNS